MKFQRITIRVFSSETILQLFDITPLPKDIILSVITPYFNVPDTKESIIQQTYPEFLGYIPSELFQRSSNATDRANFISKNFDLPSLNSDYFFAVVGYWLNTCRTLEIQDELGIKHFAKRTKMDR